MRSEPSIISYLIPRESSIMAIYRPDTPAPMMPTGRAASSGVGVYGGGGEGYGSPGRM